MVITFQTKLLQLHMYMESVFTAEATIQKQKK